MSEAAERLPQLTKYELIEEVGHGGMATVYRARDPRLDREVAVKVIHRHLRENFEVAARFGSEARAVAKLRHPNIVEVYDVSGEDDGERYLVVELVRGTTLRKLLQQHAPMPPEVAAALGLELCAALEHAHSQGVIHRDVKPENVLLDLSTGDPVSGKSRSAPASPKRGSRARVKLTDFGIAKILDAQGVTSTGQVLGSPAHMAPEQIEGGAVSEASDVFGIGVLLYECMVGHLPFQGKNPAQVLRRVLDGVYPPAEKENPKVGSGFGAVLTRALARDADERFQSAANLATELRALLDQVGMDSPTEELDSYFADPAAYAEAHGERIIPHLLRLGRAARERGEIPRATALFNRALGYKPGDADLIKQVTGMARRERFKENLRRAGLIAVGSIALGGLAYAITQTVRGSGGAAPSASAAASAAPSAELARAEPGPSKSSSPSPGPAPVAETSAEPAATDSIPRKRFVPLTSASAEPLPEGSRKVIVAWREAPGRARWNGQNVGLGGVELPFGSHTFQIEAADQECCVVEQTSISVTVVEGPGPQTVQATVKYRPATLSVSGGPAGSTVSCAEFGVTMPTGGSKRITMHKNQMRGYCTLTPPPATGSEPKTLAISVKAGGVHSLRF